MGVFPLLGWSANGKIAAASRYNNRSMPDHNQPGTSRQKSPSDRISVAFHVHSTQPTLTQLNGILLSWEIV
jgi:hypothetical protein